jgi:hypothetical protein
VYFTAESQASRKQADTMPVGADISEDTLSFIAEVVKQTKHGLETRWHNAIGKNHIA